MRAVWTRQARRDRRAIFDYIYRENPDAAATMDDRFSNAAAQLIPHPLSGRPGRVADTRELVVHPSYILIYDLSETTIRILTIVHTARQWPPEND